MAWDLTAFAIAKSSRELVTAAEYCSRLYSITVVVCRVSYLLMLLLGCDMTVCGANGGKSSDAAGR